MKLNSITITKSVKVSGNYNSIGADITLNITPQGEEQPKEIAKLGFKVVDEMIKEHLDNKPEYQRQLIEPNKPDTQGYK